MLFGVIICYFLFCNVLYLYNFKVFKMILNIIRRVEIEIIIGVGEVEIRDIEVVGGMIEIEGGKMGGGGEEVGKE